MEFHSQTYQIKIWDAVIDAKLGRFFSKLSFKENACIEWTGSLDTSGYGLFRFERKLWKAHRFMVEKICKTPISKGKIILHSCDNPKCVNPVHLSIGTKKDNALDRERKGRSNRRTRDNSHGIAKLTSSQIEAGIRLVADFGYTRGEVAKYWGISYAHACKLVKRYKDDI